MGLTSSGWLSPRTLPRPSSFSPRRIRTLSRASFCSSTEGSVSSETPSPFLLLVSLVSQLFIPDCLLAHPSPGGRQPFPLPWGGRRILYFALRRLWPSHAVCRPARLGLGS